MKFSVCQFSSPFLLTALDHSQEQAFLRAMPLGNGSEIHACFWKIFFEKDRNFVHE